MLDFIAERTGFQRLSLAQEGGICGPPSFLPSLPLPARSIHLAMLALQCSQAGWDGPKWE